MAARLTAGSGQKPVVVKDYCCCRGVSYYLRFVESHSEKVYRSCLLELLKVWCFLNCCGTVIDVLCDYIAYVALCNESFWLKRFF